MAAIALRLTDAKDIVTIRAVVVEVLGHLLGSSADGEAGLQEQSRRLDLIASAIFDAISQRWAGDQCRTPGRAGRLALPLM